jgi:hypothetical protein
MIIGSKNWYISKNKTSKFFKFDTIIQISFPLEESEDWKSPTPEWIRKTITCIGQTRAFAGLIFGFRKISNLNI